MADHKNEPPSEKELELVAAAMWHSDGCSDRPTWNKLTPGIDDALKSEFRQQARVGIMEFLRLRNGTGQ